jgi:superoxide dismutase, Fe-Mn family
MAYVEKQFDIPKLEGISEESIKQHLALYAGYVKNFNAISAAMPEYAKDLAKHSQALSELIRRRSFEWGGMRLHELYFPQLEGGSTPLTTSGALANSLKKSTTAIL